MRRLAAEIPASRPGLRMAAVAITRIETGAMPDGSDAVFASFDGTEARAPYTAGLVATLAPGDVVLALIDPPSRVLLAKLEGTNPTRADIA